MELEPRVLPMGDRHLLVELLDDISLRANIRAILAARFLEEHCRSEIVEAIPAFSSLLVEFDPDRIALDDISRLSREACEQNADPGRLILNSRVFALPVIFDDEETRDCHQSYCRTVKSIPPNLEIIAKASGLPGPADVVRLACEQRWWVGAVGFLAGLPNLQPMLPHIRLIAPKYDPPRLWTPKGTVALGGAFLAVYPVVTPDGYQMLGRTPATLFNPAQNEPGFEKSPVLLRCGDELRLRPVGAEEGLSIARAVEARRYVPELLHETVFSVLEHERSLAGGAV